MVHTMMDEDLGLIVEECNKMAQALPKKQRERLARARMWRLNRSMASRDPVVDAGMEIFQMSREWEPAPPIPKWAGPPLRAAVEKARELRQALEVSRKLRAQE